MNTISIDFGTSFTSAAWINPKTEQPEPIRFIDTGMEKIPSLVYYPPKGEAIVGEAVLTLLKNLNQYSEKQRFEIKSAIIPGLKRRLSANGIHALANRPPLNHAEILSEIFKKIKTEAEVNCFGGAPVVKVVLSHPVVISQVNKDILKQAARLAGFNVVQMIEEPVAAAMGFTLNDNNVGKGILVYDFGGGTFDVAYVTQQGRDRYQVPIPTDGEDRCGGDDIDMALYDHWETLIEKRYLRSISNVADEIDLAFLMHCRYQKESLSELDQKKFSVALPAPEQLKVTRTLDRGTLNQLMRPVVDKTILKTQSILKKIKHANNKLDTVVLIGGSSRIPFVMERLQKILPIEPLQPLSRDVAVCIGALIATQPVRNTIAKTASKAPNRTSKKKAKVVEKVTKNITPSAGDIWYEPLTRMGMVWVPAGSFRMGSPLSEKEREEDEGPLHIVTLDGFWMGQFPVTQGQWQKVMGTNPSRFKIGDHYPVEYVSWRDAQVFIKKINEHHEGGCRFALPTEAQWEYACRAGTNTPFYFGDNLNTDQANFNGHLPYGDGPIGLYREKTTPVGTFPPNSFGLFDMHGNVWEWCSDRYGGEYSSTKISNPKGPSSGVSRVLRGGCWNDGAWICRSAYRNLSSPSSRHSYTGFRLTMLPLR